MESLTLDRLRQLARLAGFDWSDAELQAMLPAAARAVEALATLEALSLGAAEPSTHYGITP